MNSLMKFVLIAMMMLAFCYAEEINSNTPTETEDGTESMMGTMLRNSGLGNSNAADAHLITPIIIGLILLLVIIIFCAIKTFFMKKDTDHTAIDDDYDEGED
jgi:hypothetical protein